MGELVSTAGLKYWLRWFGEHSIGDSSTEDMSVECTLLALASVSSPDEDEAEDAEKSRCPFDPLMSGAL